VVDPATTHSDKIVFGMTVTVEDEEGSEKTYQIVGEDEINIETGKISWKSPVAKALLGKREGDVAVIQKPSGASEVTIVKFFSILFCLLTLNLASVEAAPLPWTDTRETFALTHAEALKKFEAIHFSEPTAEALAKNKRAGARTDGLMIIHDGKLIYERYGRGNSAKTKHIAWSISKSVMSLLYASAYQEKLFAFEDPVCKFGDLFNPELCQINFGDILRWSSGLAWVEEYERSRAPKKASILAMLYGEGRGDMMKFVAQQPFAGKPGSIWRYSSGDSILLSYVLGQMYSGRKIHQVFKDKIFDPIGAENWVFERDGAGTIAGAYYLHISVPDLARIGLLTLQDGRWGEKQIFEKSWMKWAREVAPAFKTDRPGHENRHIGGGHWWLNDHVAAGTSEAPLSALPKDAYFAQGHWGQYLIVVPSQKLIIVRTGDTRDGSMASSVLATSVAELLAVAK
jgi:CubicO group peptidase (beta-lactamase class C family)